LGYSPEGEGDFSTPPAVPGSVKMIFSDRKSAFETSRFNRISERFEEHRDSFVHAKTRT